MKFSIIIPSQNRTELMCLAVHYALNQKYKNIELIVSDNSTTAEFKQRNELELNKYIKEKQLILVSPPRVLSAPDHFEFALQYATGDYVLFLTDKMMLLPDTLHLAADAIAESNAEIVNWTYYSCSADDYLKSDTLGGELLNSYVQQNHGYEEYSPLQHLEIQASGQLPRPSQSAGFYVKGKICFGCYSKELILQILNKSGSLCGGVTHDYSAMVQALCLATKGIVLGNPGIVFLSLPIDKSWGSLTYFYSYGALKYYESFPDSSLIISSLFVPGLYVSPHNMVAHDYLKYLLLYGKREIFGDKYWLYSINKDLCLPDRVWSSEDERNSQFRIFYDYINKRKKIKIYLYGRYCMDYISLILIFLAKRLRAYMRRAFGYISRILLAVRALN